jgi:hypothetical protein
MRITWNERDQFLENIQREKVKKKRILLKFLLHLHLLLLLQVQFLNPMQGNMFINIRMKLLYLNLMLNSNYPYMMVKLMQRDLTIGSDRWRSIAVCNRSRMRSHKSNWHH